MNVSAILNVRAAHVNAVLDFLRLDRVLAIQVTGVNIALSVC